MLKNKFKLCVFSLVFFISFIQSAYAYLDPGAGSALLQGLIGGIAAASVVIKMYWHKIIAFFKRNKKSKNLTKRK